MIRFSLEIFFENLTLGFPRHRVIPKAVTTNYLLTISDYRTKIPSPKGGLIGVKMGIVTTNKIVLCGVFTTPQHDDIQELFVRTRHSQGCCPDLPDWLVLRLVSGYFRE